MLHRLNRRAFAVRDNRSGNETNGINQSYGGAVYNQGSLRVASSTFSVNQALGSETSFDGFPLPGGSLGGAILNDDGASMTASQSSFVHNEALGASGGDALGGAIDNESASVSLGVMVSISNCTFVSNQAIAGVNLSNGNQGEFRGAIEDLAGTTIQISGSTFTKMKRPHWRRPRHSRVLSRAAAPSITGPLARLS